MHPNALYPGRHGLGIATRFAFEEGPATVIGFGPPTADAAGSPRHVRGPPHRTRLRAPQRPERHGHVRSARCRPRQPRLDRRGTGAPPRADARRPTRRDACRRGVPRARPDRRGRRRARRGRRDGRQDPDGPGTHRARAGRSDAAPRAPAQRHRRDGARAHRPRAAAALRAAHHPGEPRGDPLVASRACSRGTTSTRARSSCGSTSSRPCTRAGGRTLCEVSVIGMRGDPGELPEISRRSGIQIVAGTAFFVEALTPAEYLDWSVEQLADHLVAEHETGIGTSGIRAGMIGEVGTGSPLMPFEERSLRASVLAMKRTGMGIMVHTDPWQKEGLRVVDVLEDAGRRPLPRRHRPPQPDAARRRLPPRDRRARRGPRLRPLRLRHRPDRRALPSLRLGDRGRGRPARRRGLRGPHHPLAGHRPEDRLPALRRLGLRPRLRARRAAAPRARRVGGGHRGHHGRDAGTDPHAPAGGLTPPPTIALDQKIVSKTSTMSYAELTTGICRHRSNAEHGWPIPSPTMSPTSSATPGSRRRYACWSLRPVTVIPMVVDGAVESADPDDRRHRDVIGQVTTTGASQRQSSLRDRQDRRPNLKSREKAGTARRATGSPR